MLLLDDFALHFARALLAIRERDVLRCSQFSCTQLVRVDRCTDFRAKSFRI